MEGEFVWDAPPNPSDEWSPRPDRCSDADVGDSSPASSNFSSCNGSDFDRYCSANSVLESASICSSIGYYSGIGDEFSSEGYSFRGKFLRTPSNGKECLSDGGAESPRADCSNGNPLAKSNSSSRLIHGFAEISFSSCYDICGEGNTEKSLSPLLVNGKQVSSSSFINCSLGDYGDGDLEKSALSAELRNKQNGIHLDIDIESVIKLETNEDVSPQSKHSDTEASIFDDGIDSEGRIQSRERSFKLVEKTNHEDMNPPFVSSTVAFGSNDWDEFVHDTESGGLSSLSLHLDQSFQHQDEHIGRESEEKAQDIFASLEAENLRVKGAGSCSYVSAINPKAHVIDIHSQMRGSSCNIINSHGVDAVDQTAKISKYDSASVLQNTLSVANEVKGYLNSMFDHGKRKFESSHNEENVVKGAIGTSETNLNGESELLVDSLARSNAMMRTSHKLKASGGEIMRHEICQHSSILSLSNNGDSSTLQRLQGKNLGYPRLIKANVQESEVKKLDAYDSYDEMVLEMEEILLDSGNCQGSMNLQTNQYSMSHHPCHFEDASSTVSATDDQPVVVSSKIDRAEVVGAKQKKGDVSFGERLVGVREYTMYQIKVWSGVDEWKVERRYRDFFALYCQLKALFTSHGLSLPSAWFNVERDSRKLFGNASPNVVMERSILIEDCLRSILNSKYSFGNPSPLIMFLTPGKIMLKPGLLRSLVPHYLQKLSEDAYLDDTSLLGKTISLVVEVKPHKSLRQLLEIQHYTCAGCHRHLDAGKTLFRELVQTFGWNRPRFCEYTGQLFCASCHTSDTSVLPARVLHHWDFTLYSVSQFAKAYLESIYEQNMAREKHLKAFCAVFAFQPMLCVSAVNPFLFSKVPALHHVINFRKKIGAMLPYVNCPFRSSIEKSLGFRRHFLESNDFFALRDLVDLSKGPFAALPMMVENISNLIFEHITQQCLVCYDSGVSCGARQACHDPVSLIFPFQEVEVENCASCGSIFHKACYVDLLGCPCSNNSALGKSYGPEEPSMIGTSQGPVRVLDTSIHPRVSNPLTGFFTNILTKVKSDKIWKPKGSSPVILMSSLPNSSSQ